MLLFVRNPYYRAVQSGAKTFELRHGARYRNVAAGDRLSINGRERATVTHVETAATAEGASECAARAGYPISPEAIGACYAGAQGPYYLLHFTLDPQDARGLGSARKTTRAAA